MPLANKGEKSMQQKRTSTFTDTDYYLVKILKFVFRYIFWLWSLLVGWLDVFGNCTIYVGKRQTGNHSMFYQRKQS